MIILMNGAFKMNLRKRMHHKVKTNAPKYSKTKIILSLHQDFISTQDYISKENTYIVEG
jgi:hypothetical protein